MGHILLDGVIKLQKHVQLEVYSGIRHILCYSTLFFGKGTYLLYLSTTDHDQLVVNKVHIQILIHEW
jgi:hypothetical protein